MDTDDRLIELCQRGRPEGFARLLLAYQDRVYRRAYSFVRHREDALDLTQEVLIRTIKGLPGFTPGRPLWPWLRRITTNLCLNHLRAKSPLLPLMAGEELAEVAGGEDPADVAVSNWGWQRVNAALARLPPLQRMAVILRHQEGLSYEEVALALELPLGTVKTYLFRSRHTLKAELARDEEV